MNYVLYGKEYYLLNTSLQTILKKFQIDEGLNKIEYDARKVDLSVVLEDAQTFPFFGDYKTIIVYNATFLTTTDDTGWNLELLLEYFKNPLDSTILILICDCASLDGRKKIVKNLTSYCKVLQFQPLDEKGKRSYIDEQIKKNKLSIDSDAKKLLYARLPSNILIIKKEFEKLILYQNVITYEIANALITRPLEDDVFELVNAVVQRNKKKAFHVFQDLMVLNREIFNIIGALASQFRFLFQVRQLMDEGKGKNEIVSILKAHPYRTQLAMNNAMTLSVKEYLELLNRLALLDQQIKSGRIDSKLGFELFMLEL